MSEYAHIEVHGLTELARALRKVDAEFPKQLRGKLKGIAERVAALIREKLPKVATRTHPAGYMAGRTKAAATQKGAGIRWNGVPYAGAVEFGGYPHAREYIAKGRYVFPTVEAERSEIEEQLEQVLEEVIRAAGLGP